MFIRIGKRGLNTEHIVRWYKDSQWYEYGEKHSTPNLMVVMSDHYSGEGYGGAHREWFFGETAERLWEILEGETIWRIDDDEDEVVPATEPTAPKSPTTEKELAF